MYDFQVETECASRVLPMLQDSIYYLRELFPHERARFASEVLVSIPILYDEIDESFVDHILDSHTRGSDPTGYFTIRKKVWALAHEERSEMLAFTVASEKRGGSVRFGPTVVLPEYQGLGLYTVLTRLREQLYSSRGFRKWYCTCPENCTKIRLTLSKQGYMTEAILREQFRVGTNELVIGKLTTRTEPLSLFSTGRL